jgi:sugar/nucleoside kinase (ribokinase family)
MVDVYAEVSEDFCIRHGIAAGVQHIPPEALAAILADLRAPASAQGPASEQGPAAAPKYCAGGGAANVAKIAAILGAKSRFAGCVGDDPMGRLFEEELARSGAALSLGRSTKPTGIFLSLKLDKPAGAGGETRIAASPSAALDLEPGTISEETFASAKILMLEGFLLNRKELIKFILKKAGHYGITLALDPGTAEIAAGFAEEIISWSRKFPLILFMNEAEAEAFAAAAGSSDSNIFPEKPGGSIMSREVSPGSPLIAVKLAERGAAVYSGGKVSMRKTQAFSAAESTGAGDAFAAGFLRAWLEGKRPEECADEGNRSAALVLSAPGTGGAGRLVRGGGDRSLD